MDWPSARQKLHYQISQNVRQYFYLANDVEIYNRDDCPHTIGATLVQLADLLSLHNTPPFTYQRLCELADLATETKNQYARSEGVAYLCAVLQLVSVSSPASTFSDFETLLDERSENGVHLEPIEWLSS